MACFWLFVSHLLLLLHPRYHGISFSHALESEPAPPELDLFAISQEIDLDETLAKRHIVMRNPQEIPTTTGDATSTSTYGAQADQTTNYTEPGQENDSSGTTSDSEQPTTTGDTMSPTSEGQSATDGAASQTYDKPVTGYEPSVGPIEDDAAYPDYAEQVMNSTEAGQYQYQILINADGNGNDIDLGEYMDSDTSSMLKCINACDAYNDAHGSTAACQAVAYYGDSECYLLTDMYKDANSYVYYSPGGIVGLLLRQSYPEPTETDPTDGTNTDGNTDDGNYDTTATTTMTTTMSVSQSTYSVQTITPTDAYGKTTVNVYISACPTKY